mmetsp:Transcript_23405/g.73304  ORF Transcript_23405/g.73304 Transcript_23405/m.73304 type:complete len:205 (+) Transcript_23405:677-1291(+)
MVPAAPWHDSLPTSSWSKRARHRTPVSPFRTLLLSTRDFAQTKLEARLSRRPENTNSSSRPPMQLGWTSHSCRSKSVMSTGSHWSSFASSARRGGQCGSSFFSSLPSSAPAPPSALRFFPAPPAEGLLSCALISEHRIGAMWFWKLTWNLSLHSRSRCMATVGMRRMGLPTRTSSCESPPPRRTITRPATPRSRSIHECHTPPP